MNQDTLRTVKKDEIVCRQGEDEYDLFIVESGELIVFVLEGTQVTPIAILGAGDYIGELSYFDHQKRSAYVVAIEDSVLHQIPIKGGKKFFPNWLYLIGKDLAKKLRDADKLIQKNGLKKRNVQSIKPLSIENQRYFYNIVKG